MDKLLHLASEGLEQPGCATRTRRISRRAADWKERGFVETLVDFATLNRRSKFWGDDQRAAFSKVEIELSAQEHAQLRRLRFAEYQTDEEILREVVMRWIFRNRTRRGKLRTAMASK
jgi:hypothetical protein